MSLAEHAKNSECGSHNGNRQKGRGSNRGTVRGFPRNDPNYSRNNYRKIKTRVVVEPIDKPGRVSVSGARARSKSREDARINPRQNSQGNFDTRAHHTDLELLASGLANVL